MSFVAVAMGWLTDKLDPRFVVTFFGFFCGISFLLTSQVNQLWQFLIYHSLVSAIGRSTAITPIMATVARWFVRKRGSMSRDSTGGVGPKRIHLRPFGRVAHRVLWLAQRMHHPWGHRFGRYYHTEALSQARSAICKSFTRGGDRDKSGFGKENK